MGTVEVRRRCLGPLEKRTAAQCSVRGRKAELDGGDIFDSLASVRSSSVRTCPTTCVDTSVWSALRTTDLQLTLVSFCALLLSRVPKKRLTTMDCNFRIFSTSSSFGKGQKTTFRISVY